MTDLSIQTAQDPDNTPAVAEVLLRAAFARNGGRQLWSERLHGLIAADRQRHAASITVGAQLALLVLLGAPLVLAAVTGVPLSPATAGATAGTALLAAIFLPVALVWRALARRRYRRQRVDLHHLGVSATRDATGWVLRDRSTQVPVASVVRGKDGQGTDATPLPGRKTTLQR